MRLVAWGLLLLAAVCGVARLGPDRLGRPLRGPERRRRSRSGRTRARRDRGADLRKPGRRRGGRPVGRHRGRRELRLLTRRRLLPRGSDRSGRMADERDAFRPLPRGLSRLRPSRRPAALRQARPGDRPSSDGRLPPVGARRQHRGQLQRLLRRYRLLVQPAAPVAARLRLGCEHRSRPGRHPRRDHRRPAGRRRRPQQRLPHDRSPARSRHHLHDRQRHARRGPG